MVLDSAYYSICSMGGVDCMSWYKINKDTGMVQEIAETKEDITANSKWINESLEQYNKSFLVKQVELTDECIEKIAQKIVELLRKD